MTSTQFDCNVVLFLFCVITRLLVGWSRSTFHIRICRKRESTWKEAAAAGLAAVTQNMGLLGVSWFLSDVTAGAREMWDQEGHQKATNFPQGVKKKNLEFLEWSRSGPAVRVTQLASLIGIQFWEAEASMTAMATGRSTDKAENTGVIHLHALCCLTTRCCEISPIGPLTALLNSKLIVCMKYA